MVFDECLVCYVELQGVIFVEGVNVIDLIFDFSGCICGVWIFDGIEYFVFVVVVVDGNFLCFGLVMGLYKCDDCLMGVVVCVYYCFVLFDLCNLESWLELWDGVL